jgi:hypothetical protein
MSWRPTLEHRFVERIPRTLEPGVLYISMEYATAAHSCACGCGEEVMTPFTPTDWRMTFDGETVSLWPSVGNWQLACRSHYVVEKDNVIRAGDWTPQQIAAEQQRDKAAKTRYYATAQQIPPGAAGTVSSSKTPLSGSTPVEGTPSRRQSGLEENEPRGFWSTIFHFLSGRE